MATQTNEINNVEFQGMDFICTAGERGTLPLGELAGMDRWAYELGKRASAYRDNEVPGR